MIEIPSKDTLRFGAFRIFCLLSITVLFSICLGCGGGATVPEADSQNVANASATDVENQLKFDARVQDYEIDGDKLVVNVNDSWTKSPTGIQLRVAGEWFSMWKSARSSDGNTPDDLEVVIQHQGDKVATWTAQAGYKPAIAEPADEKGDE
jgi:hypothetical protein